MLSFTRNLMTKGSDGKMSKLVKSYETVVVEPHEVVMAEGESFEEYGKRVHRLVTEVNKDLEAWNGRGEYLANDYYDGNGNTNPAERQVFDGLTGALNMGIDLAHRQFEKPKKVTKAKALEHNRGKALEYAFTLFLDQKITKEEYAAGMKNASKYADEILFDHEGLVPGTIEAD